MLCRVLRDMNNAMEIRNSGNENGGSLYLFKFIYPTKQAITLALVDTSSAASMVLSLVGIDSVAYALVHGIGWIVFDPENTTSVDNFTSGNIDPNQEN